MANHGVPNAFSNFVHQCVCREKSASLFFVKVTTVEDNHEQIVEHLRDQLKMTEEAAEAEVNNFQCATGFVVGETEANLSVITCAHVLEKYYSAQQQLNIQQLENWFEVLVVCQHYEDHMNTHFPQIHANPNVDIRRYTPATIVRFDQGRDLMLLTVSKQYLYATHNFGQCLMHHPVLRFANQVPNRLDDVAMMTWPPCRDDTPFIGHVVKQSRHYGQITRDLSKGYTMRLMELDITGDDGTSGGPILNQHGRVVSMYHGRLNSVGYGISAADIRHFLNQ